MLDVHHLDSDRSNGLPENLLVLCVWCHALETRRIKPHEWVGCITNVPTPVLRDPYPLPAPTPQKANYPDDAVLAKLVWEKPLRQVAADFGVSYNAVKARCVRRHIKTPPQGHWLRKDRASF